MFANQQQTQFHPKRYFVSDDALRIKIDEFIKKVVAKYGYSEHELHQHLGEAYHTQPIMSLPMLGTYPLIIQRLEGSF